jgi:hypothetical protein
MVSTDTFNLFGFYCKSDKNGFVMSSKSKTFNKNFLFVDTLDKRISKLKILNKNKPIVGKKVTSLVKFLDKDLIRM